MTFRVLLVDDVPVNRRLMKAVLGKNGSLDFLEAENGSEALKYLEEEAVDLMILDLMMPVMDGFDVLRTMKSKPHTKNIPVIVNSAVDDISAIHKALEMGADEYFTKPLTPDQMRVILPIKVANILRGYEQERQLTALNERLKGEMRLAKTFQQTLIAPEKDLGMAVMMGRYIPCISIGGDFYDAVQVGEAIWFIIADVAGHGIAPAMVSAMVKVVFNVTVLEKPTPAGVLAAMNRVFGSMTLGGYFFSAFVGKIGEGVLTYANAGQPYPLLLKSESTLYELHQDGFMIGVLEQNTYEDLEIPLCSGDQVMLYTDGLLASNNPGGIEDQDALKALIRNCAAMTPGEQINLMTKQLQENKDGLRDDAAVMIIKLK